MTDIGNNIHHLGVGTAFFNTENNTIVLYPPPSVFFVADVCPVYESRAPRAHATHKKMLLELATNAKLILSKV